MTGRDGGWDGTLKRLTRMSQTPWYIHCAARSDFFDDELMFSIGLEFMIIPPMIVGRWDWWLWFGCYHFVLFCQRVD